MNHPSIRFTQENGEKYPDYESFQLGEIYTERIEKGNDDLPILTTIIDVSVHMKEDQVAETETAG